MTFPRLKLVAAFLVCLFTASGYAHYPSTPPPPVRSVKMSEDWSPLVDAVSQRIAFYESLQPPPEPVAFHSAQTPRQGNHRGYATAKECVSWKENHGDYGRSDNPTHFGRYQFSRSTWAAYGGNPDTWGTASPAEQDAVFETAWNSPGGPSNWLPYDGCGPL